MLQRQWILAVAQCAILGTAALADVGRAAEASKAGALPAATVTKMQSLIVELKKASPEVSEIHIHARAADGAITSVASTSADAKGKISAGEAPAVLENGNKRIKRGDTAFEITMPLKDAQGETVAAAEIALDTQGKLTTAKNKAAAVAAELEKVLASTP